MVKLMGFVAVAFAVSLAALLCWVVALPSLVVAGAAAEAPNDTFRAGIIGWMLSTPQPVGDVILPDGTPGPGSGPRGEIAPGFWSDANDCSDVAVNAQGDGTFVWPTIYADRSGYWFTANRIDPNQGGTPHLHPGVDLRTGLGDPIVAAQRGTVIGSAYSAIGYGNYLMLDHGNGQVTLYGHLSDSLVACGQVVAQGEMIGSGGSTGNSTGPHLHFEVGLNGGRVNPCDVLPGAATTNCYGDPGGGP